MTSDLRRLERHEDFCKDAEDYANFLVSDKDLAFAAALRIAGFMLLSRQLKLVLKPRIFVMKHDRNSLLACAKARVYFDAWSQNNLRAIECADTFYFCPDQAAIMYRATRGFRSLANMSLLDRNHISGALTREAINQSLEGIEWLKFQLASMS